MKNLIFGAVFALFTLTSFANNEIPNENLLPVTEITEVITIAEDQLSPPQCFALGNAVFDIIGESPESVALVNLLCAWL